jgi:hypothetical protein
MTIYLCEQCTTIKSVRLPALMIGLANTYKRNHSRSMKLPLSLRLLRRWAWTRSTFVGSSVMP